MVYFYIILLLIIIGRWLKFDDDKVSEVTEEDIKKLSGGGDWHCAYLLLYRSRHPDGKPVGPP